MRRLARWCLRHRFIVVGLWLMVFIVTFFIQSAIGSNFATSTALSGTESASAAALMQQAAPSRAGDMEEIVFHATGGTVDSAAIRAPIEAMLANVRLLPNVGAVTSPYSQAGSDQVSANRTIAFATVHFTKDAHSLPTTEAQQVVDTARAANSSALQVDVVGDVAASTNPTSSPGTIIGVVAALIVLVVVFGSLLAAMLPLMTTAVALLSALSVIGVLSNSVSMAPFTSQLCSLIGLGVGIDYALFILTRTRTGLRRGLTVEQSVTAAAGTAGKAILFAGLTVCIALLGMLTVGVSTLSGAAIAASIAVIFPVIAALTLLPALMGLLGDRILTRHQRAARARGETDNPEASRRWSGWAARVQAHRVSLGLVALAVLLALGAPFLAMRQGTPDYSVDPTSTNTTTYRAYEMLVQGFGPGFSGPLQLVAEITTASDEVIFGRVVSAARATPGVVTTSSPQLLPAGANHPAVAVADVYASGSPQDASTAQLLTQLRTTVIPSVTGLAPNFHVLVGGQTAVGVDVASKLSSKLPLFVGMVVALSFILLMLVFRSLAIPAAAALMNVLSAGAAFGVVVAVFQWGWLAGLFGVTNTGPVTPVVPILMFAVLFGLSMDYNVFLVSRIHEEWLKRHDNSAAVNVGQAVTGGTITAAATIMTVVFTSFVFTTDRTIKLIGVGMATAILLDALIVRTVLVPAVMHVLGRANWYLPRFLDRRLPHLPVEEVAEDPSRSAGARAA